MGYAWVGRYECPECPKHHVNGSAAQARCEGQRQRVNDTHVHTPCAKCRLWPAWMDGRCESCGLSPALRAEVARRGGPRIIPEATDAR